MATTVFLEKISCQPNLVECLVQYVLIEDKQFTWPASYSSPNYGIPYSTKATERGRSGITRSLSAFVCSSYIKS